MEQENVDFLKFSSRYEKVPVQEVSNEVPSEVKVSVMVQTYQHAGYIEKCIESILAQKTDFAFEILLGEDDSTDGTREICRSFASRYPNKIRLFEHHRENNIKVGNTPTGRFVLLYNFFKSRGEYLAFCEGDDYWDCPNKLQMQVDFLDANKEFGVSMGKVKVLMDKTGEISSRKEKVTPDITETYSLKDYLKAPFSQASTFVFRKQKQNVPGWFFRVHAGDQSLVVLHASEKGKIKYHNEYFSVYRVNEKSISHTATYNVYEKFISTIGFWKSYLNNDYLQLLELSQLKYHYKAKFNRCSTKVGKAYWMLRIKRIEHTISKI